MRIPAEGDRPGKERMTTTTTTAVDPDEDTLYWCSACGVADWRNGHQGDCPEIQASAQLEVGPPVDSTDGCPVDCYKGWLGTDDVDAEPCPVCNHRVSRNVVRHG